MKKMDISPWILILFCLYLFPIVGNNFKLFSYYILYLIPLFYFIYYYKRFLYYIKKELKYVIITVGGTFILLGLSIIVPVLHGTGDFSYIETVTAVFRRYIVYVFLMMIILQTRKGKNPLKQFLFYWSLASSLYVFVSLVMFLVPAVREGWQWIWNFDEYNRLQTYGYGARFGWAGFSNFRETIKCSLSLVFLFYLYFDKKKGESFVTAPAYLVMTGLNLLGNMFYGRSGVVVFAVVFLTAIIIYRKVTPYSATFVFFLGLTVVNIILIISQFNLSVHDWIDWVSTPFINLIKTGSFQNYSADHLLHDMIFYPGLKTLLIGDGMYTVNGNLYYMDTDSGFMRQILFWGIVPTVFSYFLTLYPLLTMVKRKEWKFPLMLFLCFVLYEFKGEVYYDMLPLFFVLAYLYLYDLKLKIRGKKRNTKKYLVSES